MAASRIWLGTWVLVSAVWIAGVVYLAQRDWPRISLDLSRGDSQVNAAYQRAVTGHIVRHVLLGGGLPLLFLGLGVIAFAFRRR